MRETIGAFFLSRLLFAMIAAAIVAACSPAAQYRQVEKAVRTITLVEQGNEARHIEIELDDPASSLPCSVVDRPDYNTKNTLWRAEHELGFCQRKAEETLAFLKRRGWACRPENSDERRARNDLQAPETTNPSQVIAAWRCLEGLAPTVEQAVSHRPPIPEARPELESGPSPKTVVDRVLLSAVQRDLAVIGQDVVDDETVLDSALGDLNEDGSDDAVIIVTREAGRATSHRLLMAYLRNDDAYQLVDVWVLKSAKTPAEGPLTLAIESGRVRLDYCCEEAAEPTILVLNNRKLAHAQGG
jgi:hypothetical protein